MNISANIRNLTVLFIVFFISLSGVFVYWQVIVADTVAANPINRRSCLPDSAPHRGNIYDRNGVLLATSVADANAPCGYIRRYTDPSLAGLIGYYVYGTEFPATGIEAQYNDYLNGDVGATAMSNLVNKTLHQPVVGNNIYLTIDERIQKIVANDFNTPVVINNKDTFRTDRGAVVVTDPKTGEVLAMLSEPSFDPNKMVQTLSAGDLSYYNQLNAETVERPLVERPLNSLYPPGSTYKALTLLAGLDSGKTTLNQEFDEQQAMGPIVVGGETFGPTGNNIQGYTFRFPVTTEYGFTHSDNLIFAQIGAETGASAWLDYNKRFYVGQTIPFDLPVTPSSVTHGNSQTLSLNQLAENSFGQGIDQVTPFQMSLIDSTIADNGTMMRPTLVAKITDSTGNAVQTNSPTILRTPISSQTATEVRQAMYGVSFCGSGTVAGVTINTSRWSIIAKTGTAQVDNTGVTPADGWLMTQAPYTVNNPAQLPVLSIVAMKENGGGGGNANGPMLLNMYNDIFTQIPTYSQVQAPALATGGPTGYCCQTKLLQLGCA